MHNVELSGKSISGGLAMGTAFVYKDILDRNYDLYNIDAESANAELERIKQAISEVHGDLAIASERIEEHMDKTIADVFRAQQAILNDVTFLEEIEKELLAELVNAEQVVKSVLRRFKRKFRQAESDTLRQRVDDLTDLGRRLLRALTGVKAHSLEHLPPATVLVAPQLLPSDTVFLSRRSTAAVVVEHGGLASHAALLTREMGIPAVSGLSLLTKKITSGDKLLVDGDRGIVIVNPSQLKEVKFKKRMDAECLARVEIRQRCQEPARTLDGSFVQVMANIGCLEDAHLAQCNGADGIGLYRLEQLFLSRKTPPTRHDLIDAVKPCATIFPDKPVVVRLLDAGGDKDIPFLSLPAEDNPSLGRRGVRLLLDYPDLAGAQIEAIVWLAQEFDVRILVPMVTVADDMSKIRDLVQHAVQQIGADKAPFLGAMIETPAAALCTREIAQNADFLSIGTNDLTQYTMAAGRENQFVDQYFLEDHPAVMRLIQTVMQEADGTPLEMCGELAGHTETVSRLVSMGIHTFSVAPSLVPFIKESVRAVNLSIQDNSGATQSEDH